MDFTEYSHEEIQDKLISYGFTPGPITGSTRRVYERKLAKFMGMDVGFTSFDRDVEEDDEEVSEEEVEEEQHVRKRSPRKVQSKVETVSVESNSGQYNLSDLDFDYKLHSPTARAPIKTVSSKSYTEYYEDRTDSSPKNSSFCSRFLWKLVIIIFLLTALYFAYLYTYNENPLKDLEKLAKQAVHSAKKASTASQTTKTPQNDVPKHNQL